MATTSMSSPLEVTFELNDPSILEDLKRTLKLIREVGKISVRASKTDRSLTPEKGERLVKRTLIPALKEVMEAREKGIKYPDAHDLLTLL